MTRSILGGLSDIQETLSKHRCHIVDNPELGILELYPSGVSHISSHSKQGRQTVHKELFEIAATRGKEQSEYPFNHNEYEIKLISDNQNKHDINAQWIMFIAQTSDLKHLNNLDLGYIPSIISKQIHEHKNMIHTIAIQKVRNEWFGRYYNTKIVIMYGENQNYRTDDTSLNRFSDIIMDEQ